VNIFTLSKGYKAMFSIYDFQDYRVFLNTWIEAQAKTRGLKGRLAEAMGISSTMLSLIFKGDKNLSLEQAAEAAELLALSEKETEYFFLIVELGRAGTHKLQTKLRRQIREAQNEAKKISKRVKKDIDLSDETKSIFYSSWIYSGLRNLIAIEGFNDSASLAKRVNLPQHIVANALEFLIENHLAKKSGNKITYGPARTHVASDSPFVGKHHQNWRLRGFSMMDQVNEDNLFYTSPMSLSAEAAEQVRRLLPKLIEEVAKIVGPSPSEKAYCLNLDWFEY
jgi:uncharacterized protein (TIGR02147 family)